MDLIRLFAGWALPALLGIALVRRAYVRWPLPHAPHGTWIVGTGILAGAFVLTLEMRAVSWLGGSFGLLTIGVPLLVATIALAWPELRAWRSHKASAARTLGLQERGITRIAFFALLAWMAARAMLLLLEAMRIPLYPWDAWTQWATKAKVWFAVGHMAPFAPFEAWINAGPGVYYDAAPAYPATVPLWQVWSCVAMGRWDDALMNLPWWLIFVALVLALYGFLRMQGFAPLFALVGTWLVSSMPILDAHVALAGYADLPLACYFGVGALAGYMALNGRSVAHAVVAIVLLAALPLIKTPGWVWLATLAPAVIVALAPRYGLRITVAGWIAGLVVVVILSRLDVRLFNYQLHMNLQLPWRGLVEAYLSFANWHMLFWLLPAVVIVARRWLLARDIAPLTVVLISGVMFLFLGFSLTNAWVWVEDQSTVNRATLHLAPLLATWLLLLMQRALLSEQPSGSPTPVAPAAEEPLPAVARVDA